MNEDVKKNVEAAKGVIAFNRESSELSEYLESISDNKVESKMKKKTKDDFWMEYVRDLAVDVDQLVEERLKEFDITLTPEQEDVIHDAVWKILEDVSNGNYRNYN